MGHVEINTAQNVVINYEPANIGDRLLAMILDYLVIAGVTIGVAILNAILDLYDYAPWLAMTTLSLPAFFYNLICEATMNGQSIGKRSRHLQVIKINGSQASFLSFFTRFLLRPIDTAFGIGMLVILINGKGQRLGDIAAATTVIQLKKRVSLKDVMAMDLDESYQPVFTTAADLKDDQINIIKDILTKRKRHHITVQKLSDKIKEIQGIQSDLHPYDFLQTILKDFHYYHQGERPSDLT
ncbi:MAG: RDD family protein [Flavobacteriales bacterium]|nr:RDD family protein [Flavobacteriales bacterium]